MNQLLYPDIAGSYLQGAQGRQALQSNEQAMKMNEMKMAEAQRQQSQQQQYNRLLQSGLPPEQMSQKAMQMGNVDLASKLQDYVSKQSKEQQDKIMSGAQNVYAFTKGSKDANDPVFMQGIQKALQAGMIDEPGAQIAAQLGPQGLEQFVIGAKGADGSKAFQPVVVSDASGNTQLVMPTFTGGQVGSQRVPIPQGYTAAVETPQQKREREAQSKIVEEQGKVLGKGAAETANAAFKQIESIKSNNRNLREVIRLVGTGADTGPIAKKLPSIRAASIRLDNMRGQLGLDVVGATTFGALSEAELNMALDTGLPTGLQGPELKSWAQDKINAQEKLAGYLEQQAKFLSKPGNTVADWLDEVSNQAEQNAPAQQPTQSSRLPAGVTEDDIQETMKANGMTRSQVMQRLGVK